MFGSPTSPSNGADTRSPEGICAMPTTLTMAAVMKATVTIRQACGRSRRLLTTM